MPLEYPQLKKILPQAYPFLMIDRVEEYKEGQSLLAIKNITANDWALIGFREDVAHRYFPETLLIEAAAQAALVLYHVSRVKEGAPRPRYVLGKTRAEFFKPVKVGDQLHIRAWGTKLLDIGEYSDVEILTDDLVSKIELILSVKRF